MFKQLIGKECLCHFHRKQDADGGPETDPLEPRAILWAKPVRRAHPLTGAFVMTNASTFIPADSRENRRHQSGYPDAHRLCTLIPAPRRRKARRHRASDAKTSRRALCVQHLDAPDAEMRVSFAQPQTAKRTAPDEFRALRVLPYGFALAYGMKRGCLNIYSRQHLNARFACAASVMPINGLRTDRRRHAGARHCNPSPPTPWHQKDDGRRKGSRRIALLQAGLARCRLPTRTETSRSRGASASGVMDALIEPHRTYVPGRMAVVNMAAHWVVAQPFRRDRASRARCA